MKGWMVRKRERGFRVRGSKFIGMQHYAIESDARRMGANQWGAGVYRDWYDVGVDG